MAYLEYFSPQRLALQEEVQKHPELMELLATHGGNEWETKLAEISAYCGVILDGAYLPQELDNLCDILIRKLMEKRTLVILSH